jgi:NADH-quinone oxidoreductase subunit L
MFRLFFLVFFTSYRGHAAEAEIHEGPLSMKLPLLILALLSAAGGFIGVPEVFHMPHYLARFLEPVLQPTALLYSVHPALHHTVSHSEEWMVMGVSVLVSFVGIAIAWLLYIQRRVLPPAEASASGLARLLENRLWIDEIYGWVVVMPVKFLAHGFSFVVDLLMINLSVEATGMLTRGLGNGLKIIQSGRASAYAYLMIWSVVVFALLFLFRTI